MRKVKIFRVQIITANNCVWSQSFISRPNNANVISALQLDHTIQLELPDPDTDAVNDRFNHLTTMVTDHGLPTKVVKVCTYAGVPVGKIKVEEQDPIVEM